MIQLAGDIFICHRADRDHVTVISHSLSLNGLLILWCQAIAQVLFDSLSVGFNAWLRRFGGVSVCELAFRIIMLIIFGESDVTYAYKASQKFRDE